MRRLRDVLSATKVSGREDGTVRRVAVESNGNRKVRPAQGSRCFHPATVACRKGSTSALASALWSASLARRMSLAYLVTGQDPRSELRKTVIVDECSMLTEEQLAALLDALRGVERLILVGDPNQLPPIGSGRPFVDIVQHLAAANIEGSFMDVYSRYIVHHELLTCMDGQSVSTEAAAAIETLPIERRPGMNAEPKPGEPVI